MRRRRTVVFREHLRRARRLARLGAPGLMKIVFRHGFGLGRIETGGLIEVVRGGFLGGLFWFPTGVPDAELGLGWSPGRMEEWGRGRLTDVDEDVGNGLGLGEDRNER
ncbi:hypothetical protein ACFL3S_10205 [Gemmatimonadota bacterium]